MLKTHQTKIYKANDKIEGVCSKCNKTTIGTLKNETFKYKTDMIPDILQLFCDECGNYMGKPYQSSVKLHNYVSNKL
jgi:RNase P subunit RPR2